MKYSLGMKFIAIFLTALALTAVFGSVLGILRAESCDMYSAGSGENWERDQIESMVNDFAMDMAVHMALDTLSDCTDEELQVMGFVTLYNNYYLRVLYEGDYRCVIYDGEGNELRRLGSAANGEAFTYTVNASYPVIVRRGMQPDVTIPDTIAPGATVPEDSTAPTEEPVPSDSRVYQTPYGSWFAVRYQDSPAYTVKMTVNPDVLLRINGISSYMLDRLYELRFPLIGILAAGLLLFGIGAVCLCCMAGKTAKGSQVTPGGLNRLPLDLYLAVCAGLFILGVYPLVLLLEELSYYGEGFHPGLITILLALAVADSVILVGVGYGCVAQFKAGAAWWWRRSVVGFCVTRFFRGIRRLFRGIGRAAGKLWGLLPILWRWMLAAAGMGLLILIGLLAAFNTGSPAFLLLVLLCCCGVTCYGAYAFGSLLEGAKRMGSGDLTSKVNPKWLRMEYREFAQALNNLSDVAVQAAKNQMKSERMKTELITNVSHDIKTPLTSIINYVDLLEKPHTPEEGQQYLEVLGRQSQRMKKLIEDLMDMSKASSGNMPVEIGRMDAAEAVNQALGEFADKLEAAGLTTVFRKPEGSVEILADGRLTWRVLSNLLGNAVKYALPGTRLYIDLEEKAETVTVSLKNISREELNISAEELTERFVRGDASRNTEGSGLGLNIARSLMELQNGRLQLLVDGDLFKVTLYFSKG